MSTWSESLRAYRQPRLLAILFMGFSSGLPLPLTASILSRRLTESGVPVSIVTLFAYVGIPYSLKFLWAPFIDRLSLPWPFASLGRRRSWAILTQCLLIGAIVALGRTAPSAIVPGQIELSGKLWMVVLPAMLVAFLSASQDVVIDAYRIELLAPEEQGAGAAATQWGYRFGLMASSAGALYVAEYASWSTAHTMVAALMSIGLVTVLLTPEPAAPAGQNNEADSGIYAVMRWLEATVAAPFREFLRRPEWALVLAFVMLYKFGDSLVGVAADPFYVKMGFSKIEVANISKLFGSVATLAGFLAGGTVVYRLGLYRSMLVCGVLQMLSNLLYAVQALSGHDPWMLALTIGVENFTGAMGSVAFIAYLSNLCNVAFTGTQYALLSSIATLGRTSLSAPAGWLAVHLGWATFFVLTTCAALPGIALMVLLMKRYPQRKPVIAA